MSNTNTTKTHRWLLVSRDGAFLAVGRESTPAEALQAGIKKLSDLKRKLGTVKVFTASVKGDGNTDYVISQTKVSL